MKERFAGRLVTLKPDFSVSYNMSKDQARRLHSEVFAAGTSMNLIFLDCDASCPEDLELADVHAHIVYIQIARQKVLHKLIKEMTANSRERDEQLHEAYHLYESSVSCHWCMCCLQAVCADTCTVEWNSQGWELSTQTAQFVSLYYEGELFFELNNM